MTVLETYPRLLRKVLMIWNSKSGDEPIWNDQSAFDALTGMNMCLEALHADLDLTDEIEFLADIKS